MKTNQMKAIEFDLVEWDGLVVFFSIASFIKKWMIHFFNYGVKGYMFWAQWSSTQPSPIQL